MDEKLPFPQLKIGDHVRIKGNKNGVVHSVLPDGEMKIGMTGKLIQVWGIETESWEVKIDGSARDFVVLVENELETI